MKKKLLSILLVFAFVLSAFPAGAVLAADTDPEGTIIVLNNTSSLTDETRFTASAVIEASWTTNGRLVDSKLTGYNGRGVTAVYHPDTYARWYFAKGSSAPAGTYDVYVYNVINNGTDLFRNGGTNNQKAQPGYHTRYTVNTRVDSNNGVTLQAPRNTQTTYYVNQATASVSTNGWVKLGTHYFSGVDGAEYVELRNDLWNSYAYASAVKFVPVDRKSSAKLTHVYTNVNTTAAASVDDTKITKILCEEATVDSNRIVMSVPKEYGAETTVSGGGTRRKLYYTLEAEDPNAKIYNDKMTQISTDGKAFVTLQQYIEYGGEYSRIIYVESEDGTNKERYDISFVVEKNSSVNLKVPTSVSSSNKSGNFWIRNSGSPNSVGSMSPNNSNVTSGWGVVDTSWTGNAKLGSLGNFAHWTLGTDIMTAGYYNLYLYPSFIPNIMGEYAEVIVDHAGIIERKLVMPGKYHKKWMTKVFAGTYYFDGSGNEAVAVMNPQEALTDKQLCINGMQLVPAGAAMAAEDFAGIAITAGEESASITKTVIAQGDYVQPVAGTDVSISVIGNNNKYEYITLNGETLTVNTAKSLVLAEGGNDMTLEIKLTNQDAAQTYTFSIYAQTDENSVTRRLVEISENGYSFEIAPVSLDPWNTGHKTGYMSDASAAAAKNYFSFRDTLPAGYYKLLAWVPGFSFTARSNATPSVYYGGEDMPYTVTAANGTFKGTVDWTSSEGKWVDLGSYYFNDAEQRLDFGTVSGKRFLLDTVKFIKLSDGITVDGVYTELNDINDKVFYTESTDARIMHAIITEDEVKANEVVLSSEAETNIALDDGVNNIEITVGEDKYNFAVVKTGTAIAWADAEWNSDPDSVPGVHGYNGNGAAVLIADSVEFAVPDSLSGEYDAYVYFVPVDAETLDGLSAQISISVADADDVYSVDYTPQTEGWYKAGDTYRFDSSVSGEKLTVAAGDDNIAYISAVKFVNKQTGLSICEPEFIVSGSNVNAWAYAYNGDTEETVTAIIASYDKITNKLLACKSANVTVANGFIRFDTDAIAVADMANTIVKAFVWDGTDGTSELKPLTHHAEITAQ
ncbi:MAG: hypothetical protein J6D26_02030 [Clostridia bacterium]|nr:hypothetical protein [Clostridia bacterium]